MEDDEKYIETIRLLTDQLKVNQEIDENGMSEELLMRQVDINKRRCEFNIADNEEIIFTDDDGKEFVQ